MVHLIRFSGDLHGTRGMLFLPDGWNCCVMEPPWLHNTGSRSCIPEGKYRVIIVDSPKYGRAYEVQGVPDRTDIMFHSGNYAGDEESGFKSDTDGCVLPGEKHGVLSGQKSVLNSRATLDVFMGKMQGNPFDLVVKGEPYDHRLVVG